MLVTLVDNILVNNFGDWLQEELTKRDMTQADLSRKSGLTTAGVAYLVNGKRNPGADACIKIAHALRLPETIVLRVAGFLPPAIEMDELKEQILFDTADMTPEEQREILAYIRMKKDLRADREENKKVAGKLEPSTAQGK